MTRFFFIFCQFFFKKWRKTLSWKFMDESSIKYLRIHKWDRWIRPRSSVIFSASDYILCTKQYCLYWGSAIRAFLLQLVLVLKTQCTEISIQKILISLKKSNRIKDYFARLSKKVHLRICKYFMDDSSINFHDKFFLHFLLKFCKTCHENLRMSCL